MLTLHVIWVKTGLKPTFTKQNNIIALYQNKSKERGIISIDQWIKDAIKAVQVNPAVVIK